MTKIAYASDFHFEFYNFNEAHKIINDWNFDNDTDIIIIAGDLHVGANHAKEFLEYIYKVHDIIVLFVPGNHEYYGSSFATENKLFNTYVHSGCFILNKNSVAINNVVYIGCTGNIDGSYEEINSWKHGALNDFNMISDFDNHDIYGRRELNYMHDKLMSVYKGLSSVCITHTMPSPKCISPKYRGDILNACFTNNWEFLYYEEFSPKYHIFGHTHDAVDLKIENTRLLANPYGYPMENKNWKWEYIYV